MKEPLELPDRIVLTIARAVYECDLTRELVGEGKDPDDPPLERRWGRLTPADRVRYERLVWDVVLRHSTASEAWARWKAWEEPLDPAFTEAEHRDLFNARYQAAQSVGRALVAAHEASRLRGVAKGRRRWGRRPRVTVAA